MADYGTRKNGGQYMSCITCKRRYYTLKDKTMKTEDTKPKNKNQTMYGILEGTQELN